MLALYDEQAVAPIATSSMPLWLAIGLVLITLAALPFFAWLVRTIVPGEEESCVNWRIGHVAVVVLVAFIAAIVAGLRMRSMLAHDQVPSANEVLILSAVADGIPVLIAAAIALVWGPRGLAALGLRRGRVIRAPIAGLLVYLLALPGLSAVQAVWVWILGAAGQTTFEQPLIELLAKVPPGQRFVPILIGVFIVPLLEEVLFRGFLQPVLVQRLRPLGGIVVTSAIFGILHGVESVLPIFALSCVLGYVMLRTQRLHAVWAIHAAHNGLQFLMLYVYPQYLGRAHAH